MTKLKTQFVCNSCGAIFPKWIGQCLECNAWNSLVEEVQAGKNKSQTNVVGYAGESNTQVLRMTDIILHAEERVSTNLEELDRVLGGGLVYGSVVLIGGDPGIGKSTLILQTLGHLSQLYDVLYVTGEESLQQVTMRAKRLDLPQQNLKLLTETCVEKILFHAAQEKPRFMVIDSIQTIYTELLQSASGSVGQIRESTAQLVQFAKQTGVALIIIGHVTKEGTLAGPRVLEHMVDTVLYFEGDANNRFRLIRAVKNRFGAVNELGIFAMTDKGLREINNPSAIFLSRYEKPTPGSSIFVTWEGSRPMLVEIQALVDISHLSNPRRVTVGLDQQRLAMLLAVLHRHGGIATYDQDVFINVVGGIRVTETGADLPLLLSVISSLKNQAIPDRLIVFGEVGLAGEIRPVPNGQERLREAAKHGFTKAIIPKANAPKEKIQGMEIFAVQRLDEALRLDHF